MTGSYGPLVEVKSRESLDCKLKEGLAFSHATTDARSVVNGLGSSIEVAASHATTDARSVVNGLGSSIAVAASHATTDTRSVVNGLVRRLQ
jgi:uncharacterized protein YfiM (DUF2279 family)